MEMGKEAVGWGRLSVRSEWPWGPTLTARRSALRFLSSNLPFLLHGMPRLQFQLTSWESGALTGRCLQNAKHLGGQGGGSYSLFLSLPEKLGK